MCKKVRSVSNSAEPCIKGHLAGCGGWDLSKTRHIKKHLPTDLLEIVHEAAAKSDTSVNNAQASQNRIKQLSTLSAALEEISWLHYFVRGQERWMEAALSGFLRN